MKISVILILLFSLIQAFLLLEYFGAFVGIEVFFSERPDLLRLILNSSSVFFSFFLLICTLRMCRKPIGPCE